MKTEQEITLHIPIEQRAELDKAIIARDILAEGYITYVPHTVVVDKKVYAYYVLRVDFASAEEEYARDFLMRAGGRPPLPRYRRPPLAKHSPAGRKWAEFYEEHGRAPTVEEWKAIT